MKHALALTVFLMMAGLSAEAAETPDAPQPVRVDAFGDALPPGALFRLGCTRLHHLGEIADLWFSPDGRAVTTISASGTAITWEITRGKETRRMKLASSNGRLLLCRLTANPNRILAIDDEGNFFVFSAFDGKLVLRTDVNGNAVHLSADGKRLIFFDNDDASLRHLDGGTGRLIKTVRLALRQRKMPSMAFSPDGRWFTPLGLQRIKGLELWDTNSGKQIYVLNEKGNFTMATPAFSPDGRYVAAADSSDFAAKPGLPVIIWDLVTGKEVRRLRVVYSKKPRVSSIGNTQQFLAFSGDGNLLAYVEGYIDGESVWVWDVKTGKIRQQLKAMGSLGEEGFLGQPKRLVFSRDGTMLAAGGESGAVLIWNLTNGKRIGHDRVEVFDPAMHYVGGGKGIVVGYAPSRAQSARRTATGVWDVGTGRRVLTLLGKELADVSATGELLAVCDVDPPDMPKDKHAARRAEILDLATGRARWHSTELGPDLRFSSDGKKLGSFGPELKVHDARTGKELSRLKLEGSHAISHDLRYAVRADLRQGKLRLLEVAGGRQLWEISKLPAVEGDCVIVFSPDGELLAVRDPNSLSLWQTKTGKQLLRTQRDGLLLGFSPDGHTLLFQEGQDDEDDDYQFYVRTFSLGKKNSSNGFPGYTRTHPRLIEEDRAYFQGFFDFVGPDRMTFQTDSGSIVSADSKILVTAADPYLIQVWETATGKLLCRFQGDRDGAHIPVLAPDCRTLTTQNANGTITVWDLTGLRLAERKGRLPVSAAEFERCWTSFADDRDGESFFRGYWKLAADPEKTVARLRDRLKPVPATDPKRISQWIAQLNSKEFARRSGAAKELEGDESALPILRSTLQKALALEAQQRITKIVEKLEAGPKRNPEVLRAYRLVQLLEQIGSPAARDLLRTLSHGAKGAMLTSEAQDSLRRLGG